MVGKEHLCSFPTIFIFSINGRQPIMSMKRSGMRMVRRKDGEECGGDGEAREYFCAELRMGIF